MAAGCKHLVGGWKRVVAAVEATAERDISTCDACAAGEPQLWLCVSPGCSAVGCGRRVGAHALAHWESSGHQVVLNCSTAALWCFACDDDVTLTASGQARLAQALQRVEDGELRAEDVDVGVASDGEGEEAAAEAGELLRLDDREHEAFGSEALRADGLRSGAPGLCGLRNLGNTCYFNACLQALSSCPPLARYMVDVIRLPRSSMSLAFAELMASMWSGRHHSLAPRAMVKQLWRTNEMFAGYGQQDSHEALRCVLDTLHEEMAVEAEGRPPWLPPVEDGEHEEEHDAAAAEVDGEEGEGEEEDGEEDDDDKQQEATTWRQSIVSDCFMGVLRSDVTCERCGTTSTTRERFYDLSLSIPEGAIPHADGRKRGMLAAMWNWLAPEPVSLDYCLRQFCLPERLTGSEAYRCESCESKQSASKALSLVKLPEVLCIQLKRFRADRVLDGKVRRQVVFPLEGLSLQELVRESEFALPAGDGSAYNLLATVRHMGGMGGGHYIAYARNRLDGRWYEFDDSQVRRVSPADVRSSEAYVLLYQRVQPGSDERRLQMRADISRQLRAAECEVRYVVREWFARAAFCAAPSAITNAQFACPHGYLQPLVKPLAEEVLRLPLPVWRQLQQRFGGGPEWHSLRACAACAAAAGEMMERRRREKEEVLRMDSLEYPSYCIVASSWLRQWRAFLDDADARRGLLGTPPPGPIDNRSLLAADGRTPRKGLRLVRDYRGLHPAVWQFLHDIYGGGPLIERAALNIYQSAGRSARAARPAGAAPVRRAAAVKGKLSIPFEGY